MADNFLETACQPNPGRFCPHSLPWVPEGAPPKAQIVSKRAVKQSMVDLKWWQSYITHHFSSNSTASMVAPASAGGTSAIWPTLNIYICMHAGPAYRTWVWRH